MRTQVGIIGAGPAGLLLSNLLQIHGIGSVVVEAKSREYVERRVRAGVLEQGTVDLLVEAGLGDRIRREGLVHGGISLLFGGRRHRVDLRELTGGRCVTVYGQQEVVKDLIASCLQACGPIVFGAERVCVWDFDTSRPKVRYVANGADEELDCDFLAGCDGFHGVCRPSIPAGALRFYSREYPFAWLGILAQAPPVAEELIYAHHEHGFALCSMRSPAITRLYLQCAPDEDLSRWPDERVWEELNVRLWDDGGFRLREGPILQQGVTPMRSFVCEPMQCGRLFLAGDAAHIVPPTGAKGMNLAMADANVLARALHSFYSTGSETQLAGYSEACLRRVWRAQHFSHWMTSMLHRFPGDHADFDSRRQIAELESIVTSRAASAYLAAQYVGLALDS